MSGFFKLFKKKDKKIEAFEEKRHTDTIRVNVTKRHTDTIRVNVANKLYEIVNSTEKEDVKGRWCYEYNGIKYYFTNSVGEYADSSKNNSDMEKRIRYQGFEVEFFTKLIYLKGLDMSKYDDDMIAEISWYNNMIQVHSPTELRENGENNVLFTLYDAVLKDETRKYDAVLADENRESIEEYKKDAINLEVVKIISGIMTDKKIEKIDNIDRVYYEFNGKNYYFTNSLAEYPKSDDKDSTMKKGDFFNSLDILIPLDIKNYYNEGMHNKISFNMLNITGNSPTELRESDADYNPTIGVKRYKLYDAVLADVKNRKSIEGGKRKSKGKSNKVSKKPAVSQKKLSIYKEIFGKQMKIYKMPDSRKEYVKYKGELHPISEYKSLMKQKALAKPKPKPRNKI
jgi:hypothetical protein